MYTEGKRKLHKYYRDKMNSRTSSLSCLRADNMYGNDSGKTHINMYKCVFDTRISNCYRLRLTSFSQPSIAFSE